MVMAQALPSNEAVRRARQRTARAVTEAKLDAAFKRITDLEAQLDQVRKASSPTCEVALRLSAIAPVLDAALRSVPLTTRQRVLRNLASHQFDLSMTEVFALPLVDLNRLQRSGKRGPRTKAAAKEVEDAAAKEAEEEKQAEEAEEAKEAVEAAVKKAEE